MVPAGQPSQIGIDQEAWLASPAPIHIGLALAVVVIARDVLIDLATVKVEVRSSVGVETVKALPSPSGPSQVVDYSASPLAQRSRAA